MVFSFKYKSIKLKSGEIIHRPMIPISINGKERLDIIGILDSGSDMTILPKEIAEVVGIDYQKDNEISGISGNILKAKQGKINIIFGKAREFYNFDIPVLVPEQDVQIIIGRLGFFERFKITFVEDERKISFKKQESFINY